MSRVSTNSIAFFCAAVAITIFGCGEMPAPQHHARTPTGIESPKEKDPGAGKEHPPTYITCRAKFTAFVNDHPWFDDSGAGHDDGKVPLASFVLVEPAAYAKRGISILFKYGGNVDNSRAPDQAGIGSEFTFQVPADFFRGDHKTIDNAVVRNFHKVEP